ncbi:MAG: hypothetical protein NTZ05_00840 [Chloroflexi bacterium]|nr:hypothetical protein [Chloroflexota bacterium]
MTREYSIAIGVISIVQEDRFRLITADGRGLGFILGARSWRTAGDLRRWRDAAQPVEVRYHGEPDMGAVAVAVNNAPTSG